MLVESTTMGFALFARRQNPRYYNIWACLGHNACRQVTGEMSSQDHQAIFQEEARQGIRPGRILKSHHGEAGQEDKSAGSDNLSKITKSSTAPQHRTSTEYSAVAS